MELAVQDQLPIVIGRIVAHFGLKGWVKIQSYTRPVEQVSEYHSILVGCEEQAAEWQPFDIVSHRKQGNQQVIKISGWETREAAQSFIGCYIGILRSHLAKLNQGEYYWVDLIGLRVVNNDGLEFGQVESIMATGANDVLMVRGNSNDAESIETLIPWIPQVVQDVNLVEKIIYVKWQIDYL